MAKIRGTSLLHSLAQKLLFFMSFEHTQNVHFLVLCIYTSFYKCCCYYSVKSALNEIHFWQLGNPECAFQELLGSANLISRHGHFDFFLHVDFVWLCFVCLHKEIYNAFTQKPQIPKSSSSLGAFPRKNRLRSFGVKLEILERAMHHPVLLYLFIQRKAELIKKQRYRVSYFQAPNTHTAKKVKLKSVKFKPRVKCISDN